MWSEPTFSHVAIAVSNLQARVQALQALVNAGPELASPSMVRDVLTSVEDSLTVCWAPVIWDADCDSDYTDSRD
jgi:hypothetical protein